MSERRYARAQANASAACRAKARAATLARMLLVALILASQLWISPVTLQQLQWKHLFDVQGRVMLDWYIAHRDSIVAARHVQDAAARQTMINYILHGAAPTPNGGTKP